jgi:hypothetical protein
MTKSKISYIGNLIIGSSVSWCFCLICLCILGISTIASNLYDLIVYDHIDLLERELLNIEFIETYGMSIYDTLGITKKEVLKMTKKDLKDFCKKKYLKTHPDRGGDQEEFKKVRKACMIFQDTIMENND